MPRQEREAGVRSGRFRLLKSETGDPISPLSITVVFAQSEVRTYRFLNSGRSPFKVLFTDADTRPAEMELVKNQSFDLSTDKAVVVSRTDRTKAIEGVYDRLRTRGHVRSGRFKSSSPVTVIRDCKKSDYRFFNNGDGPLSVADGANVVVIPRNSSADIRVNTSTITCSGSAAGVEFQGSYDVIRRESEIRSGRFKISAGSATTMTTIIDLAGTGTGLPEGTYRIINSGTYPFAIKKLNGDLVVELEVETSVDLDLEESGRKLRVDALPPRQVEGGPVPDPSAAPQLPIEGVYEFLGPHLVN